MKRTIPLFFVMIFGIVVLGSASVCAGKKRILYIDSDHPVDAWSADVAAGVEAVLAGGREAELKIFHMDAKRNQSDEWKKAAALKAKRLIESWRPDVVIASGDDASKHLIVPWFKGAELPFVFCGLNRPPGVYGFPADNVTGVLEVDLYASAMGALGKLARGGRVGFLAPDAPLERRELKNAARRFTPGGDAGSNTGFSTGFTPRLVGTFDELKRAFLELQKETDMVLLRDCRSVKGFDHEEMVAFVNANTSTPICAMDAHGIHYALLAFSKNGQAQGARAARIALEILAGASPRETPVAAVKRAKIYLNVTLAKKTGVTFPGALIERAQRVSAKRKKLLYVNSYHKGYRWSDDIEKGLLKALAIQLNPDGSFQPGGSEKSEKNETTLRIFRMNTKLNTSEDFKKRAALSARTIIEEWRPDIVVASDDNAAKYLIAPYYINARTPFIFCGLNWDASVYGLPAPNVTGMVEVAPVLETIAMLKPYARGDRIGFIGSNTLSSRKEIHIYKKMLGVHFTDGELVDDFAEWKEVYLRLQDSVDMIIWVTPTGIKGWRKDSARAFILRTTKVPSG
ncbi:MAG: hypothetical protein GY859_31835, partial [Desulfobacterales bacterium]|nr:hypothetical protein [Desulfobacterales bacterium]